MRAITRVLPKTKVKIFLIFWGRYMNEEIIIRSLSQYNHVINLIANKWREMAANSPMVIVIKTKKDKRSIAQHKMLHSMLGDLEKQVSWHGRKLSLNIWKRLCMAAFLREQNQVPMLVPALDGYGVDIIFERTSQLSTKDCRDLIEWIAAFGTEHNVNWTKYGKVDESEW